MERKVTKLEHSHVEVAVVVDQDAWKAAQKKAFDKLSANVTVDGFRKGKAPEHLIRAKVDQMKVMDEAINSLLPGIYRDIISVDGVKPYAQPKVDITKISDVELELKFSIVTAPEVKLGAYTGKKVGHTEVKVEDKDVEEALEAIKLQNASLVLKEGPAALGDTVVLDFAGSIDGKLFDGGSAKNHELELGSGTFIPGFEDQLVGVKAGDHVHVNVTFPENYTPELKGKTALFECEIHEVKGKKVPELTDELVVELKIKDVATVEQLKAHKKNELLAQKKTDEKRAYLGKLIDLIAKDAKADIPDEIIESQITSRREDLENKIQQSGLNLEQYLQIVGQKEEEFLAKLKEESIHDVTNYMVMEEIAKAEKIEVTDEELEFEYAKIADQYKMKIEDVKKALANQETEFRNNMKMNRVEEFLISNNE
ncbi:MAG: trigger factor [Erysipelotrichaceae bacterium]|nr:trigger factor [Bacilli bacterium]NLV28562.1 trigger factor [Erysipelotrichaceae bacterium]HPY79424.1 trigger factor [Bacilli bacterium]HQA55492.1 trigger factor [Bacilli bacterium]